MIAISRYLLLIALIAAGLVCGGCESGKPPVGDPGKPGNTSAAGSDDGTEIPKDAQFTIVCHTYQGDTHVQLSRQVQQGLLSATKMKNWYVVHSADHSTLYYGFYRCIDPRDPNDGDEGKRALTELATIRAMTDSEGNRVFSECLLVAIDAPDPEANPAWDITRAKGMYSIEIAAYTLGTRKQDAVDSVREMRKQGIEAYYLHGTTASSVCIGCWPSSAIVKVSASDQNTDPNQGLVVTAKPLAPSFADPLSGQGVKSVADHAEIVDPTLVQELSKWKYHATNDATKVLDPNTDHEVVVEKPFVFEIPHKDPLDTIAGNGAPVDAHTAAPATPLLPAKKVVDPNLGQLKSIGD